MIDQESVVPPANNPAPIGDPQGDVDMVPALEAVPEQAVPAQPAPAQDAINEQDEGKTAEQIRINHMVDLSTAAHTIKQICEEFPETAARQQRRMFALAQIYYTCASFLDDPQQLTPVEFQRQVINKQIDELDHCDHDATDQRIRQALSFVYHEAPD